MEKLKIIVLIVSFIIYGWIIWFAPSAMFIGN
jgi:hypothetical protein